MPGPLRPNRISLLRFHSRGMPADQIALGNGDGTHMDRRWIGYIVQYSLQSLLGHDHKTGQL